VTLVAPAPGALFFPELIAGPGALAPEQRAALEAFFAELAARRQFPLHSAVLWNALVWGLDVDSGTYLEAPIDDLAVVHHAVRCDAVPVGAFVKVPFGGPGATGHDEFWGEVVYKEGRAEGLEGAWVPAELSGAPAAVSVDDDGRRHAVVREALVIDFDAILEANPHDLQRQSERRQCIDLRRHVVVDAVYDVTPGELGTEREHNDAELDDATFFAHWMVEHHAQTLRQGVFGAGLGPDALSSDAVLVETLVSSLATIEDIASTAPGCRTWRGYLFDEAAYEARVADTEDVLGGADMEHLARSLSSVPRGETVAYAGLSTRVAEEFGDDAQLHGPDWATVVCHQSTFTLEWLERAAPDGVLATSSGPVHLRLDDEWQAGGVWRAQALLSGPDPICSLPSDLALGLGYAEANGLALSWPETPEEGRLEADPEAFETTPTDLGARVVLSATDIDTGRLRLPAAFLEEVRVTLVDRGQSQLVVRVVAEDYDLGPTERTHWVAPSTDTDGVLPALIGVAWVWPFVVGLRAEVIWTRGTTVVDVTARLRLEPLVLGDTMFRWDCDEVLYARAAGLTPPLVTTRARTLRDLILEVFRTKARADAEGHRRATLAQLSFAVYGPGTSAAARGAVEVVVATLCKEGVLTEEPHAGPGGAHFYVWSPRLRPGTRVADRDTLNAYQGHMVRYVREHEVGLHLRRLTVSPEATPWRAAQYRAEWEACGRPWWLPAELPRGYTFVQKHVRGH